MRRRFPTWLAALLIGNPIVATGRASEPSSRPPDFQRDVLPVFEAKCLRCHGAKRQGGKLDMRTVKALLAGGVSGPAITPGDADKSLLIELIHFREMPPRKEQGPGVTPTELELLRKWITAGKFVPSPPRKSPAD